MSLLVQEEIRYQSEHAEEKGGCNEYENDIKNEQDEVTTENDV